MDGRPVGFGDTMDRDGYNFKSFDRSWPMVRSDNTMIIQILANKLYILKHSRSFW